MSWNKLGFLKAHPMNINTRDGAGNDNSAF